MMNIISNCCLGAFITRDILKQPFTNPFVWAWTNTNDTCKLVANYATIDFTKFRCIVHNGKFDPNSCFDIVVDNYITICYSHYQFNPNDVVLRRDNSTNMVYSNRIWEYVVKKYVDRTQRLLNQPDPAFVLCDNRNGCGTFTESQVKQLSQQSAYKVVFCSAYDYRCNSSSTFFPICIDGNRLHDIVNNYATDIIDFISN